MQALRRANGDGQEQANDLPAVPGASDKHRVQRVLGNHRAHRIEGLLITGPEDHFTIKFWYMVGGFIAAKHFPDRRNTNSYAEHNNRPLREMEPVGINFYTVHGRAF